MTGLMTLSGTIRSVAEKIMGHPVTDFQITKVANAAGCQVRVTHALFELDLSERIELAKYMMAEGRAIGLSKDEMTHYL